MPKFESMLQILYFIPNIITLYAMKTLHYIIILCAFQVTSPVTHGSIWYNPTHPRAL